MIASPAVKCTIQALSSSRRAMLLRPEGCSWLVSYRMVPSALATAMGLEMDGALPTAPAVARALGERRVLIVLDNCEHVIDAAAQLAEAILRGCTRASLLVTSREDLRIESEKVFQVPSLDIPAPQVVAAAELRGHSAVQRFLERMRAHATNREPPDAALPVIPAICPGWTEFRWP